MQTVDSQLHAQPFAEGRLARTGRARNQNDIYFIVLFGDNGRNFGNLRLFRAALQRL